MADQNPEVPLENPPRRNVEGDGLANYGRWMYSTVNVLSIFMAVAALVFTRMCQKIIGDKAELNATDATTGKSHEDDLKLYGQRTLEMTVGAIVIVVIIVAGIFGQWLYGICHQVADPRRRKVARIIIKVVFFGITTALFYFATKVGDKAFFHRKILKGGSVNTLLDKFKVSLDLKYGDK